MQEEADYATQAALQAGLPPPSPRLLRIAIDYRYAMDTGLQSL